MIRRVLIVGILLIASVFQLGWPVHAMSNPQKVPVVGARTVVGSINFTGDRIVLSAKSKQFLDAIAPACKKLAAQNKLLRLEGFCEANDESGKATRIAMWRAEAVADYLRTRHRIQSRLFVTGFSPKTSSTKISTGRVDVVAYDSTVDLNREQFDELIIKVGSTAAGL